MTAQGKSSDNGAWFDCSHCGYHRAVPVGLIGKKAKCPNCKTPNVVTAAPPEEEELDLGLDDLLPDEQTSPSPVASVGAGEDAQAQAPTLSEDGGGRREHFFAGGISNVLAGACTGIVSAMFAISFALLIFSVGNLYGSLSYGIGLMLVGGVASGLLYAFSGRVGHVVSSVEGGAVVLFFLLLCKMMPSLLDAGSAYVLPTVLVTAMLASLLVGVGGFLLVRYGGHTILRYVPIHVIGGVIAGLGVYMVAGALLFMVGGNPLDALPFKVSAWAALSGNTGAGTLRMIAPGVLFGLLLFALTFRYRPGWVLALGLLGGVGAGELAKRFSDNDMARVLLDQGWLPHGLVPRFFWAEYSGGFWDSVLWSEILRQDVMLVILAAVVLCGNLLHGLLLEGSDEREYDLVAETRAVGLGNALSGICGGFPASMCLGRTLGNSLSGGRGALSGLVSLVVFAAALGGGGHYLHMVPLFVPSGVLLFVGLGFVRTWLLNSRRDNLVRSDDYLLLLLTFALTVSFGVVVGAGAGLFMATVVAIRRFSGQGVVSKVLGGSSLRSNVERSSEAEGVIREHSEQIFIMRLSGFLFLGSMHSLQRELSNRLQDSSLPQLRYVLVDMQRVSGFGSAVRFGFRVLAATIRENDLQVVFTSVPMEMEDELRDMLHDVSERVHVFVDLDYGMEWCEDCLLDDAGIQPGRPRTVTEVLRDVFPDPPMVPYLVHLMQRRAYGKGRHIFHQGDQSKDMYFIESGRVNIVLELEGGRSVRLKMLRPGTVFGEMGIFKNAPRSASAVAAEDCVIYRLTGERTALVQKKAPRLAAALQTYLINLLADRLASANRQIRDLNR